MSRKPIVISTAAFLTFVLAAFIPYTTVIAPTWRVQVRDLNENVCVDQRVTQMWGYETLEIMKDLPHGGNEARLTGVDGTVEFPERTIRASFASRVLGNVLGFLGAFVHQPGGPPVAYIYATGIQNAEHGFGISYRPDRPAPNLILVDECFDGSGDFYRDRRPLTR